MAYKISYNSYTGKGRVKTPQTYKTKAEATKHAKKMNTFNVDINARIVKV